MMRGKLIKSEFGKNVLTLMTGSTIAQIIPIALTPILTRLFSPEEFGTYTLYIGIITFLLVIVSARYENAIPLPKDDKDAVNILALSFLILTIMTCVLFLVLIIFSNFIQSKAALSGFDNWIWFVPISVFFASSYRIFTFWSNRKKRFRDTSSSIILQTTVRTGIQLAGGLEKFSVFTNKLNVIDFFKRIFSKGYVEPSGITTIGIGTFIVSHTVGFFVGTIVLLFSFFKKENYLLKEVNFKSMKRQAKIYEKFPKINSFHALSDELKNLGLSSIILYSFNEMILGFYGMTLRILGAPLAVIGTAFSQVFYQKASEMHAHQQNVVPLIRSTVRKMALIAAPIFIVILFFGPPLFDFILGEKWRIAGVYAQYLTPWLFLSFAISPVLQVAVILNRQGEYFIVSLVHNIIIIGAVFLGGILFNDLVLGFLILSTLQIVFYFFVFRWIIRLANDSFQTTAPDE